MADNITAPAALTNDSAAISGSASGIALHAGAGWPVPPGLDRPADGTFDGMHLAPRDPTGAKLTSGTLAARFGAVSSGPTRQVSPFPTK